MSFVVFCARSAVKILNNLTKVQEREAPINSSNSIACTIYSWKNNTLPGKNAKQVLYSHKNITPGTDTWHTNTRHTYVLPPISRRTQNVKIKNKTAHTPIPGTHQIHRTYTVGRTHLRSPLLLIVHYRILHIYIYCCTSVPPPPPPGFTGCCQDRSLGGLLQRPSDTNFKEVVPKIVRA